MSVFSEVSKYLYPVDVQQTSGMEVTYFWEINASEVEGTIYVCAEEKSFGQKIPWQKSSKRSKEEAAFEISGRCYEKSK